MNVTARVLIIAFLLATPGTGRAQNSGEADLTKDHIKADGEWTVKADNESGSLSQSWMLGGTSSDPYTVKRMVELYVHQVCGEGRVRAAFRHIEVRPNDPSDPDDDEEIYLFDSIGCVDLPEEGDGGGALPPPRQEDVHDSVAKLLPTPELAIDPSPRGVTGMETYLWYEGDRELEDVDHDNDASTAPRPGLSVTASAGPYSITATAYVSEYRWDMGDGGTYASHEPGSHEDPAATHVYETKGDYTVITETVWVGSYSWAGPGNQSGSGDLGSVTRRSEHDYRVVEIRSVLTD